MPIVKYYKVTTGVENEIVKSVNFHRFNNGEIANVEENIVRVEADEALIIEWVGVQNCDPVEYPTYEADNYARLRAPLYDPMSEQIDRITKTLAYLKEQGIDIGTHGVEQVDASLSVKERFPK